MTTDNSTPEVEPLDDDSTPPGAPDGNPTNDKIDWKKEAEEARARRDAAAKKAREANERAKTLEAELELTRAEKLELEAIKRKLADDEAAQKGDIEAIRKSAAEIETNLKTQIERLKADYEAKLGEKDREVTDLRSTYLLKNEVMREIEPLATEGMASTIWLHLGSEFELGEDMKPRPKNSVLDIKSFVQKTLEEKGLQLLLRNGRAKGTDSSPVKTETTTTDTTIPADLNTWDAAKTREWMAKHPKLAAQAAQSALNKAAR